MENATIIQLQPSESITNVVRFEDTFGEYSEASGRRRKRRQERRLERIKNRQERRKLRREGRLEAARERNEIKGERRRGRLERRHMKDQYDNSETGNGDVGDNSNGGDSLPPIPTPIQDSGSYQDNYQDTSNQGSGGYQGGNDYANDGASADSYSENEDNQMEDNSEDTSSEDSGFDGVMGAEDRFAEFTDSDLKVNPTVQDIANKIEWNKELISRLRIKAAVQRGKNQSTDNTLMDIEKRKLRITELENQLKGYSNAEGEFSSANGCYCSYDGFNNDTDSNFDGDNLDNESLMNSFDGDSMDNEELMSSAEGRRIRKNRPKNKIEKQKLSSKRKKEVGRAYNIARKERNKISISNPKKSNVTPVSASLKPVISPNRIEVTLNAEGTGNIGLDNIQDFDAPKTRIIEMTSSADGSKGVSGKGILIGIGIAAVAIWALNKYKIV